MDWNPRYLYRDLFEDEEEMEYFLANVCNSEWNEQQDAGRSILEATTELQNQFPEYSKMIQQYYDGFETMLGGTIGQNVDLIYQLKGKYRLFGLTNWSGETIPIAFKKFDFFKEFEGIVVSGDEKMIKPDRKIYHLLLERYQIAAENSVFIDDNIKNIEVAQEIGFRTVHYNNGINVETEFRNMGLL